jgi:signal transduction histidine kinase/ligand-binding sensor domain-containing protein
MAHLRPRPDAAYPFSMERGWPSRSRPEGPTGHEGPRKPTRCGCASRAPLNTYNAAARQAGPLQAALLLLLLAAVPSLHSDVPAERLINVWTVEDGLKSSSVTAIAQTFDGYLWVGTYNGLARFDGMDFVVFDPANTAELRHARVRRLYVDPAGTLWVTLHDGSITSWRQGHFSLEWAGGGGADVAPTPIPARTGTPSFLLNNGQILVPTGGTNRSPWAVFAPPGASAGQIAVQDWDDVIWTRGRNQELLRLQGGEFQPVRTPWAPGSAINFLTVGRVGRLWAGTDHGLWVWDGQAFQDSTPTNAEPVVSVQKACFLRNGDMWLLANNRLRRANGRQWVAEANACNGPFVNWENRLGLHEDAHGKAWLYHYGRGLFELDAKGGARLFGRGDGFPGRRVDCFFEDREGDLWVGVDRGGLVCLRERPFTELVPDTLSGGRATVSVAEDPTGGIWVGTFGAGLHQWTGREWKRFFDPESDQRGYVFSVAASRTGEVWASAGEEDLFVMRDNAFVPSTPSVHGVKALLSASDGTLWVGTKAGLGYVENGVFHLFYPSNGVPRLEMRALAEDQQGGIWAGCGDGILYRASKTRAEAFVPPDARPTQPIWSLLVDAEGTVWAGTFRGGLLRYAEGKFTRIATPQGLRDDVICQLLDDGLGNLWMGSQQGIFRVRKSELDYLAAGTQRPVTCTAYGRYDGLPSLECSGGYQPAACRTHTGRLLFATLKGVVTIDPSTEAPRRPPPPVVVEGVAVDGQTLPLSQPASSWRPDASQAVLKIRPGGRQLEFQFAGVSLVSPDRVRFRHRLIGWDPEWVEAGSQRVVRYNSLPPKDYTFEVSACNGDGVWAVPPASITVRLLPHYYQTWWFITCAGVAVLAATAGGLRAWHVRRMRQQLARLERQQAVERDRARIAKDIHDDLGAGLTHIALLSEMARPSAPAEMDSQLAQITEVARELTTNMDEIVWAVNPENDTLDGLATYVSKFAHDYLTAAGIRCRLDLPARLPAVNLPAEMRHNLFLAVKEALNNVVKHAHASEVRLCLELFARSFKLTIEDNGCGLNGGDHAKAVHQGRVSTGHGLPNLQQRLETAGGRCVLASQPGQGTRIEFTVPLDGVSPELAIGGDGQGRLNAKG